MAVAAVMSVVIQKVTDLLIQESIFFDKVIDRVEDIRLELRQMRGFLTDAEECQKTEDEAKEWVGKYLETLYNVEDIVEIYVLRLVRKKTGKGLLQNYGLYFHDWTACKNLRWKLKQIEEKIKKLNESKPLGVEDVSLRGIYHRSHSGSEGDNSHRYTDNNSQTERMCSGSYEKDDSDFVAFKDVEENLEKMLTSNDDKFIRVVGLLGSGKTTLVKRVYNSKSIKEQFVYLVWLNVSEEYVFKDLLLRIWNQVNKNRDTELTVLEEERLKHKLHDFFTGKKYLIVLDDVRKQPDAWSKLISALPSMNGCKVVLITRQEDIGECWEGASQPLKLRSLNENESWALFRQSLCQEEGRNVPVHDWNQILRKCPGLPLNMVLLGGFLSIKRMNCEEWTRLCAQENWGSMDLLLLSYTDLPAHYKLCLLYLTLFPKEFDISVRRIIRLWLAEGFLRSLPGMGEDLAQECFNDLASRNLIKVSKFRSDGGPRKCRLPGFLREQLSPKAQEISLFHIHQLSAEQGQQKPTGIEAAKKCAEQSILPTPGVRRIVEYADIKDCASDLNFQNLRSYLSFNFQRYDTPAEGVGNFLQRIIGSKGFGLLRVLDLEGVYKPILPTTLKHLFQLRYLGLRWTFLDSLPKSVGDLPYLETLDLKGTYINTLPSSVWKLQRLRHLNLPQVRLDMTMQQPSSQLLTLWGLIIDDGYNIKKGLNQLDELRELGITCKLNKFDELLEWITGLTHLQSLSLTSKDNMSRPSSELGITLQPLSELHKLSHLKLLGKLNCLLRKDQFPPNLRVLTLSVSNLDKNQDPVMILSQLQSLFVLRLLRKSYCGQKMQCPENGFKNLRVLKLWMLDELEELVVMQGGFPSLKELNIRCCKRLIKLPDELLKRTTLKELILTNMPEELGEKILLIKSENTSLQTNSYEFTPLPASLCSLNGKKNLNCGMSPQQADCPRLCTISIQDPHPSRRVSQISKLEHIPVAPS